MSTKAAKPASPLTEEEKARSRAFRKIEFGYAAGSIGHIPTTIISSFFLTFCTYVLELDPAWMAGLFFVGRIWDGINDPLIGSLPDRWKIGKSGDRFKPYMKVFMGPFIITAIMCFIRVPFDPGSLALYAWIAFVYIASETCNTGVYMAYNAMNSVVTSDPAERTKLARGKTVASAITGIIMGILGPLFCFDDNNQILPNRVLVLAIGAGILTFFMYIIYFKWVPENIHAAPPKQEKYSYGHALKNIVSNRNLLGMMLVAFGLAINAGNSTVKPYLFMEYYKNVKVTSLGTIAMPFIIVCIILLPKLVKKVGTRKLIVVSLILNLICRTLIALFPIQNVVAFMFIESFIALFILPIGTINMVLTANAIDYGEWKTGERNDGATFAIYTFAGKIGVAISSAAAALGLSLVGYVPGLNVVQSEATVTGIRWLYVLIPVVGAAIILLAMGLIYNLDDKKLEEIHVELKQRRAEGSDAPAAVPVAEAQ